MRFLRVPTSSWSSSASIPVTGSLSGEAHAAMPRVERERGNSAIAQRHVQHDRPLASARTSQR